MRKPRIIFFDIDGTEPDLDDYFAVAKSTVPVSPDFDAMARRQQPHHPPGLLLFCRSHPAGVFVSVF